ncbi:MAG TPA: peptide ABC transporter substrate-binding protein [Chlamydiales bacterium]|nr:peptide ABC transporter substrate-binding protein [Chlamydiales bacterium]
MIRLCILFFLFFSSCSREKPSQLQIARLNLSRDPTVLDPRRARDLESITLIRMLFEGLTRMSQNGEAELAIADKVEIDNERLRFVFHLRKSYWSNHDPLTAFDFATSWKTVLDPCFASDVAHYLYPIKNARKAKMGEVDLEAVGVQALDECTLLVELEQPTPYFLKLLTLPVFFPVPSTIVAKNSQWCTAAATLVCNGPFVLTTWEHANRLGFSKNALYWEENTVRLSSIDFFITTPDTALQMFEKGKLDWSGSPLSSIPPDAMKNLKNSKQLEVSPFLATAFYRINTAPQIKGKPNLLADPKVRRSLAFAIDREKIVNHVLQGGEEAARSLVPPQMGLQKQGYFQDRNIEVLNPHFEDPLTISYLNSERNASIAQAIQNQWESTLRIKVHLEAIEPKTFFQRISNGEYQIAAGSWTADFDDPINFLEVFKYKEGGANNTGWENQKYIDLLNRSYICEIEKERSELLKKAEEILMEEMPIIPIFHFSLNFIKNPQFAEVSLSPLGQIDLRSAYFTNISQQR